MNHDNVFNVLESVRICHSALDFQARLKIYKHVRWNSSHSCKKLFFINNFF